MAEVTPMRKHPVERESIIIGRSGFSGLSLVHGWQHQVRSGVESVGWVWHGVYKFLHFRNASFGKVTDGFSFILNEYRIMKCFLTLLQLLTSTPSYAAFIYIAVARPLR